MTLAESGIKELLRSGAYRCLDREAKGADPEKIQREAFSCDTYFCSSNAVTEAGELYNVDGIGNRVAAMIYGPKSVIVVVGYNKIVPTSRRRGCACRDTAAPANATRLDPAHPLQGARHLPRLPQRRPASAATMS